MSHSINVTYSSATQHVIALLHAPATCRNAAWRHTTAGDLQKWLHACARTKAAFAAMGASGTAATAATAATRTLAADTAWTQVCSTCYSGGP